MRRTPTRSRSRAPRRRVAAVATALLAAVLLVVVARRDERPPGNLPVVPTPPGAHGDGEPLPDPFAWAPAREDAFVRRAALGASHGLYAFSPGGVEASAARTARWRGLIEATARRAGVDPDRLEGLIFLESAGREDAITPAGVPGAAGIAQIVAGTGQDLLGMRVDVAASQRLTRLIFKAERRGRDRRAARLRVERARVDERFDPRKALAGTARYLQLAKATFGREDLALESYHMGMGNLEGVLRAYAGRSDGTIADVVRDEHLTWGRVYFDSTPTRHAAAYGRMYRLGDDSANYLWKADAGREIMRLYREDRGELRRLAVLQTAKNSAEEVLHPGADTSRFADPDALRRAYDEREVLPFPDAEAVTGLRRDPRMGQLANRLRQSPALYRGLRPEALALTLYLGAQVRAIAGTAPLTITSTVRDEAYQRALGRRNIEAARDYSLHTTGWAFDVLRQYRSGRQARAFQFMLDRLQVLGIIAWVREPAAIHIAVSRDAKPLLPLLDRIGAKAP